MKRLLATVFYMLLTILGLSFVTLIGIVAAQMALGKLAPAQLRDMLRVMGGHQFYVLPSPEYDDYREFVRDRDALRRKMVEDYGTPPGRVPGQQILRGERELLEQAVATAKQELSQVNGSLAAARARIQGLEDQLGGERRLFANQVAREAAVRQAELTQRFKSLIASSDAGVIGEELERMPPAEAARWVRDHMPADFAAEALGDLPLEVRMRIRPLVEDPNAGMAPDKLAEFFAQRRAIEGTYGMGPLEIYSNLRRTTAERAMQTLLALPPALRAEVESVTRNPPPLP